MSSPNPATYRHDGERLATEYLERVVRDGIDSAELTAAVDAWPELFENRGRIMPNPVFLGAGDSALLARQLDDIYNLLVTLPQRRFSGSRASYARMLGLPEAQIAVLERAPRDKPPPLARADLYRTGTGFSLLEMNIGSSLGGFENGEINRALTGHPVLANFVQEKRLTFVDTAESLIGTALAIHAERSSTTPAVALVDWPDTYARHQPRLEVMAGLCRRAGVDAFTCHLGELRAEATGLSYRGRHVDVVYRFYLLEYVSSAADIELLEPLLHAADRGMVTLLSPADADLYGYKEGLALLSELVHTEDLDDRERDSVTSLVPWTRRLRTSIDDAAGEPVDAVRFATAKQSELILKPVSLHGGSGIVAGWTVSAEEWRRNVADALDGPYILQQRVRPVPDPVLAKQTIEPLYCNWGIFLARPAAATGPAAYSGCLIRASHDPDVDVISMANGAVIGSCLIAP
ncbi:MAG TPA: hypothetical protein VFU36_08160 [Jatrophihabitans sp.]|nr:hypothetical protein [Jatrophihabitans sp.]